MILYVALRRLARVHKMANPYQLYIFLSFIRSSESIYLDRTFPWVTLNEQNDQEVY